MHGICTPAPVPSVLFIHIVRNHHIMSKFGFFFFTFHPNKNAYVFRSLRLVCFLFLHSRYKRKRLCCCLRGSCILPFSAYTNSKYIRIKVKIKIATILGASHTRIYAHTYFMDFEANAFSLACVSFFSSAVVVSSCLCFRQMNTANYIHRNNI